MSLLLSLLIGCAPVPHEEPILVRGGWIVASGEGRPLAGDRVLVSHPWTAGETLEIGGQSVVAPVLAECVSLFEIPLGDVERIVAMGGASPDTALAFSPDGTRLAIGAYTGDLLVVDAWTGTIQARRHLAETLIKRVAWAPDGRTLYAAEQSPDAYVHALEPTDLRTRHQIRLADVVQTSAPPPGDDLYGVYTLPAAYWLRVLADGDVLVAAAHGWNDADGVRRNRSQVFRLDAELRQQAVWPPEGPADAVFLSAATDLDDRWLAVSVGRSAAGPAPADLPVNGVAVLSAADLSLLGTAVVPPLEPYFDRAYVWDAIGIDAAAKRLFLGFGDGRVVTRSLDGGGFTHALGTPILAGEVPIVSSVGHLAWTGNRLLAVTSSTNIPFGAAQPELRPPRGHPNENALFAFDIGPDVLELAWTWRGPHQLEGLSVDPTGTTAIVGAGPRESDDRTDLFGALVFELGGDRTGTERLAAHCATEGPVFFRHAVAVDGRIAVAELPRKGTSGVEGAYRAVVFR